MKNYSVDLIRSIEPTKSYTDLWGATGATSGTTTGETIPDLVLHLDAGNTLSYPRGGNIWYDLSGRGNNAFLASESDFQMLGGGSIHFNSTTPIATKLSHDFYYLNNNITLESVIYCDYTSGDKQICSKGFGYQYRFRVESTGKLWVHSINNGELSGGHINKNTWTHVAAVLSQTGFRIYINGILVGSNSIPYSPNSTFSDTTSHLIGGWNSVTEIFYGNIATQKRYNRALSGDEILQNFNLIRERFGI